MTPENQRIAIAEACGYADIWEGVPGRFNGCLNREWSSIPDYLNDLNAMHEAEKVLHGKHNGTDWLRNIYEPSIHPCATAAQHAEAFLRTLNLWKS